MRIKINNIAKVIEADINMDGISVIAGYNNIGKSTILKSIYTAVNTFRNSNEKIINERKHSLQSIIFHLDQYYYTNEYDYLPDELLSDFSDKICKNIVSLLENEDLFAKVRRYFHETLSDYDIFFLDNKIYSDEFLIPIFKKIEEVFKRPKESIFRFIGDMYIKNTFNGQINFAPDISSANIEIHSIHGKNNIEIKNNKIEKITFDSINEPDVIYFPTYNILDIINNNYSLTRYSPEADIYHYLRDSSDYSQTFEEYTEIESNKAAVEEILNDVVNGNLKINNNGTIVFDDGDFGVSVNIKNAASGIKSFLLIKKLVENGYLKRNGILLIDEPETNLHPEWHLKFAEMLVLMNKNMGIVSVVNSHSPYFIRALEVMMADHGIKNNGSFYLLKEKDNNRYVAENVTKSTECIYETLYKPLEIL